MAMCDGQTAFDPELIGPTGLALADALNLWGMQGVELAASAGIGFAGGLSVNAGHAVKEILQLAFSRLGQSVHLALHIAHEHPKDGALAAQHFAQALELLGMSVTPGLAPQRAAFSLEGLLR